MNRRTKLASATVAHQISEQAELRPDQYNEVSMA